MKILKKNDRRLNFLKINGRHVMLIELIRLYILTAVIN